MSDDRRADGSCNHRYCDPLPRGKVRCRTCGVVLTVRTVTR